MAKSSESHGLDAPPPPLADAAPAGEAGQERHAVAPLGHAVVKPPRPGQSVVRGIVNSFLPNRAVSPGTMRLILGTQLFIALLIWLNSPFRVLPRPGEVARALQSLWMTEGLGPELITSFKMNLEALGLTALLSLVLSYLTVLPVFRPLVAAVSKGRFLSLVGFTLVLTLIVGGGHPLKVSLLVFGMTVFFVTSMAAVIAAIPREEFNHARTLRMNEWEVVWEVVILGTADRAFEVFRQNAAIGWMMLTMVEGIARSEGGIGAMLLNESKHFRLAEVFAIQFVILGVGLVQDYAIGLLRRLFCPYAYLTLERKES